MHYGMLSTCGDEFSCLPKNPGNCDLVIAKLGVQRQIQVWSNSYRGA